jgi:hypothetical protein
LPARRLRYIVCLGVAPRRNFFNFQWLHLTVVIGGPCSARRTKSTHRPPRFRPPARSMLTCHARSDDVTARPLPDFRRHIVIVNDNLYIRTWREPGPARRRRCVSFSFLFDIEEFDFFFHDAPPIYRRWTITIIYVWLRAYMINNNNGPLFLTVFSF